MKKMLAVLGAIAFLALAIVIWPVTVDQAEEKTPKAGVLMVGHRKDNSWNEAHWLGIREAALEAEVQVVCEENVAPEDCAAVMERLIGEGCNIIINTSVSFEEGAKQVAPRHHDVSFLQATGNAILPNLSPYMGRMYQARYLAGIVAGSYSRTGAVGYVTTVAIPETIRGINAFALGVRRVNPRAEVYVKYTEAWSDDEAAKKATEALLAEAPRIDVLGLHIDTYGPLDVAREHGIRAIGCNSWSKDYRDVLLTAVVWQWDRLYAKQLQQALRGGLSGRNYLLGIESGIVDLAPLSQDCSWEAQRLVWETKRQLVDGSLDVFYGPIRDRQGIMRAVEGESIPDRELFGKMDWYVEGVRLL